MIKKILIFLLIFIGLQIWSSRLLIKFYAATVFADIANTDYEGEVKNHGDTVLIRTVPDITIRTYVKGQKLTYETPESAKVTLTIDKGYYFAFSVNSVDKRQSDINFIDKWSADASEQMKISVDTEILASQYASAAAANKGIVAGAKSASYNLGTTASSIAITKTNVLDYIVDCNSVLSEQNLPESDRWLVIPEWMGNYLKKSDLKDASLTGDTISPLRNGRIGRIDNFIIYISNNYTAVTDTYQCYNIIFGHKSALTFAAQMTEMETLKNPDDFGDLIRGLNIYGRKVVKPASMGVLYARKG